MSEKMKDIAGSAPPISSVFHGLLKLLDTNLKKPMEGTVVDMYLFEPVKQYYISAKRLD
jgi:hypothetical protein|tara:strand:+ start:682 stop:858 length:177 start_codon:yes stop_codon:yes gene_type:complete